jgi:hypothetical protein
MYAISSNRYSDSSRKIAISDQVNARALAPYIVDQLFVTRPVQHDHGEVIDIPVQAARYGLQILRHRRVQI